MGFHVSFSEERFSSGHSVIKPRSLECCSEGCPGSFFHLHTGSLELSQSDHKVLGHLTYRGTSHPISLILWAASLRKSPGCSELLLVKNYGGHCSRLNLKCRRHCFVAFPRSFSQCYPVSEVDFKVLLLIYKALNRKGPKYITNSLVTYFPLRTLPSSAASLSEVPSNSQKKTGGASFINCAAKE